MGDKRYGRARIVGARAGELSHGAPPFGVVTTSPHLTDPVGLAAREYEIGTIPVDTMRGDRDE